MVNAELIMTVKQMENRENWLNTRMQGIGGSDAADALRHRPGESL